MTDITIIRNADIQEALLKEVPIASKEEFMKILSCNPTSLRITIEKKT